MKRQKNSPGKSKAGVTAEKQRKHLAKHLKPNTHVRADELKWMLNHSPYIADSGFESKHRFVHSVTTTYNSQRQLRPY